MKNIFYFIIALKKRLSALVHSLRNIIFIFYRNPDTPLRLALLAAYDYIAFLHKIDISKKRRIEAALFTDIASHLNKYYDNKNFDLEAYKNIRRITLKHPHLSKQIALYRNEKKALIQINQLSEESLILATREKETELIFFTLSHILCLPISSISDSEHNSVLEKDIYLLLQLGLMVQSLDDLIDADFDFKNSIPSFVTAYKKRSQMKKKLCVSHCLLKIKNYLILLKKAQSEAKELLVLTANVTYFISNLISYRKY